MAQNLATPINMGAHSPVPPFTTSAGELPLHLIATLLKHIEDLGDLARLCCTCRLLFYMGIPELWKRVTLRSYAEMRYVDGRPEGFGGGSPFAMGLSTLVTGKVANYVQSLTFSGEWKEWDSEDYAKGRVPDNAMMLNINVLAAIGKMPRLEEFKWELGPKLSKQVYVGLSQRPCLKSLKLRFPSTRIPKPTFPIPAMPHLEKFVAYDIDPLAYPDDISDLILHGTKLKSLDMHFNPRIRRDAEQSIHLPTYFGKALAYGRQMKLDHFGFYNLFATAFPADFDAFFGLENFESMTLIHEEDPVDKSNTIFVDSTWELRTHQPFRKLRKYRGDPISIHHARSFSRHKGMVEIYFVGLQQRSSSKRPSAAVSPASPLSANASGGDSTPKSTPRSQSDLVSLPSEYLATIQSCHGETMKRLLLHDTWLLEPSTVCTMLKQLPNLEQLGVALADKSPEAMRAIMPNAPKLWAYRALMDRTGELQQTIHNADPEMVTLLIAYEFWRPEYKNLKIMSNGCQVYRLGGIGRHPDGKFSGRSDQMGANGTRFLRQVERRSFDDVKHIEIFAMDTVSII